MSLRKSVPGRYSADILKSVPAKNYYFFKLQTEFLFSGNIHIFVNIIDHSNVFVYELQENIMLYT